MKQKPSSRRKRSSAKSVLRLPDLEHAKAAVLNSLNSVDAKRAVHLSHFRQLFAGNTAVMIGRGEVKSRGGATV